MLNWLWDCIFPIQCVGGCGQYDDWLCQSCAAAIIQPSWYSGSALGNVDLGRVFALGDYHQPTLRRCLHKLKYDGWRDLAYVLGNYLCQHLPLADYDCIIPVPVHQRRLRARGFHHIQLLASAVPLRLTPAVIKLRQTKSQATLNRAARLENLRGAFGFNSQYRSVIAGRRCLLLDDVYSTGTTLRLCAQQLRQSGAITVDAAVVAMNQPL